MRYRFDDYLLDTSRFELRRDGEPVHVEPQVFDVLAHLVEHRDRVVPKPELLDAVWGDQFVSESALTTRLKQLRKAVGDSGSEQRIVRTVHGRGYQFVAAVEEEPGAPRRPLLPTPDDLEQQIRFCSTPGGVRLGYALVGSGPPLVRAAHWITHLDYDWQSPVWHHWLVGLARGRTFVRYDERGCGLSEHDVDEFSMDCWVQDLETVVDDLGLERFPLLGVSQGGAVAVAYAARHPERVSHLVLYGAYAVGRTRRARTEEQRREAALQVEMVRVGWGREDPAFRRFFTSTFIPDGSPELWDAFAELLRRTTSTENAARLLEAWGHIDVTEEARRVQAPTLVMHARDEIRVPLDQGLRLAELIPGSRFVPLDSRNHLLRADEPAWERFLAEVDAFLGRG
ncbi:MAG: alpha/beta fold hydrolase [Acidimicrobiia bacterium]|nr:alpha/beta fold hydrolase [Acidimicrobiia bacterium]